jgi:hypothetical protein
VSYNIGGRGVGVFVRGERGIRVRETTAQLAGFSLEVVLGCPVGNPNFPFLSWLRADVADPARWPECHDWLFAAGDRYAMARAVVLGGAVSGGGASWNGPATLHPAAVIPAKAGTQYSVR